MNERELQEQLAQAKGFTLRQRLLQTLWKLQQQPHPAANSNEESVRPVPATPRFASGQREPLANALTALRR
jgi:hypothetical protein